MNLLYGRDDTLSELYRRANLLNREVGIDTPYLLDAISSRDVIEDNLDRDAGAGDMRLPGTNGRIRGNACSHTHNLPSGYSHSCWWATLPQASSIQTMDR